MYSFNKKPNEKMHSVEIVVVQLEGERDLTNGFGSAVLLSCGWNIGPLPGNDKFKAVAFQLSSTAVL